jgi:hypothetical protein
MNKRGEVKVNRPTQHRRSYNLCKRVKEVTRLHNEVLLNSYASQNIISVIKSRRMRWAGHVVRCVQRDKKCTTGYNILVPKPERKRPIGPPSRTPVPY